MPNLVCKGCGTTFFQHRGRPAKTCPECRAENRRYGPEHEKLRAELAPVSVGTPCSRCGRPMLDPDDMDLDHRDDGAGYRGMAHRSCNRRAGAIRGNKARARAYREAKGLPEPKTAAPPPATGAQPGDRRKATGKGQLLCPSCWQSFPFVEEIFHEGEWVPVPTHRPGDCATLAPEPAVVPKPTVTVSKTAKGTVTLSKEETKLAEQHEGKVRLRSPYRRAFYSVVEGRWIGC